MSETCVVAFYWHAFVSSASFRIHIGLMLEISPVLLLDGDIG